MPTLRLSTHGGDGGSKGHKGRGLLGPPLYAIPKEGLTDSEQMAVDQSFINHTVVKRHRVPYSIPTPPNSHVEVRRPQTAAAPPPTGTVLHSAATNGRGFIAEYPGRIAAPVVLSCSVM
eukprot:Sspe_Gene.38623::Locus_18623_Transcript_1_1_Confidence_1.000_Length_480::g.38623::m.38623